MSCTCICVGFPKRLNRPASVSFFVRQWLTFLREKDGSSQKLYFSIFDNVSYTYVYVYAYIYVYIFICVYTYTYVNRRPPRLLRGPGAPLYSRAQTYCLAPTLFPSPTMFPGTTLFSAPPRFRPRPSTVWRRLVEACHRGVFVWKDIPFFSNERSAAWCGFFCNIS